MIGILYAIMNTYTNHDRFLMNQCSKAFQVTAINFAIRHIQDGKVRLDYIEKAKLLSNEYLNRVNRGQITPYQAASEINLLRNEIMEFARLKSSDLGRAKAQRLKQTGKVLEELAEKYAKRLYGKEFTHLTKTQQDKVYREITKAAGKTNSSINVQYSHVSKLAKGLLVVSLAISVYNVATADDKVRALGNEGVMIGGGFAGGAAGGAAGLLCGPGAPVCVTIGIFVGGVLGALGADFAFDSIF